MPHAPNSRVASPAWVVPLVLTLAAGCAHTKPVPPTPAPGAPREARERFYEQHKIVETPGMKAVRYCVTAWHCFTHLPCGCDPPCCVPFFKRPWVQLGNGQIITRVERLGPLVPGTEADEALGVYESAQDAEMWFGLGIAGCLVGGMIFLLLPALGLDQEADEIAPEKPAPPPPATQPVTPVSAVAAVRGRGRMAY